MKCSKGLRSGLFVMGGALSTVKRKLSVFSDTEYVDNVATSAGSFERDKASALSHRSFGLHGRLSARSDPTSARSVDIKGLYR